MGTNYYAYTDSGCSVPSHGERLHIGKSSMGWKFGFQAYPERHLTSFAAWKAFLHDRPIEDEYGDRIDLEDFIARVESKQEPITRTGPYAGTSPAWCHVSPVSEHQRLANPPGPFSADFARERYHDAEGYDMCNYEFS